MFAMDMMERRIREVFATLLSKGAKALERTAGELEQAASDLRQERERRREEAEQAWSEEPRREPDTMIRSTPLRAVPDTPTDESPAGDPSGEVTDDAVDDDLWTPPEEPPQTPDGERSGDVDATVTTSTDVAGPPEQHTGTDDRLVELSAGTVSQIRSQLGDLSPDELRRLRELEMANRNRTTLISAIDRALILTQ